MVFVECCEVPLFFVLRTISYLHGRCLSLALFEAESAGHAAEAAGRDVHAM